MLTLVLFYLPKTRLASNLSEESFDVPVLGGSGGGGGGGGGDGWSESVGAVCGFGDVHTPCGASCGSASDYGSPTNCL